MIGDLLKKPTSLLLATTIAVVIASCSEENTYVAPPPPRVDVQPPLVQQLTVYQEFPGLTEPFKRYEVRTRVTGFLEKKNFKDGEFVEKERMLFAIERVQFDAAVTKAQGDLDKAQADLDLAKTNFERKELASRSGSISKIDVAEALAEQKVAGANVTIAEAQLTTAEQNLQYCEIKSAISGRVSRSLVDEGNLVSSSQSTLLATVVQDDPIFVTIDVSQREILGYLSNRPSAEKPEIGEKARSLKLRLEKADGTPFSPRGEFHSLDNEIDTGTGTIEVTAQFPNPDGELAAGLSVRLKVPEELEAAVLVPAAALQRDLLGTYVFVLGKDNIAERRGVTVSKFSEGKLSLISSGLGADDRIIVSNLQLVRAGGSVTPTEVSPPVLEKADAASAPEGNSGPPITPSSAAAKRSQGIGGARA